MPARLLTRLGDQCDALFGPAVTAVLQRRFDRLWTGPAAALLVVALAVAARTGPGHAFVMQHAVTHPGDPLPVTLVRLPLSMFAPAALLPFWFAVLQVLVVFSLSQAVLGACRTLTVAMLGHTLATLSAPMWLLAGPPLGLAHSFTHLRDAGPSAAVVTLLAFTAVTCRVDWLVVALVAYHLVELGLVVSLASREHLIGTVTGVVAATATAVAARGTAPRRRSARPAARSG